MVIGAGEEHLAAIQGGFLCSCFSSFFFVFSSSSFFASFSGLLGGDLLLKNFLDLDEFLKFEVHSLYHPERERDVVLLPGLVRLVVPQHVRDGALRLLRLGRRGPGDGDLTQAHNDPVVVQVSQFFPRNVVRTIKGAAGCSVRWERFRFLRPAVRCGAHDGDSSAHPVASGDDAHQSSTRIPLFEEINLRNFLRVVDWRIERSGSK